jgi:ribosomal protein S18 acetylase RimI-like enzyme
MALEAQGMHFLRMHASLQDHVSQANPFLWKLTAKRMTEQPEYCRKMLSNKDIIVLVVHDSETETNVGVGVGWKQTHEYQIPRVSGKFEDIWVDPEHRRKGLCKRLVSHLTDFFASVGVDSLEVQYVEGNYEAEQTWAALGFHTALKTAYGGLAEVEQKCST